MIVSAAMLENSGGLRSGEFFLFFFCGSCCAAQLGRGFAWCPYLIRGGVELAEVLKYYQSVVYTVAEYLT